MRGARPSRAHEGLGLRARCTARGRGRVALVAVLFGALLLVGLPGHVLAQPIDPSDAPPPPDPSQPQKIETLVVPANRKTQVLTLLPLVAGEHYELVGSGVGTWGLGQMDVECANLVTDPTFLRDRFPAVTGALDVVLNNNPDTEWLPIEANPDGCNVVDHRYRLFFTPTTTAKVGFRVLDTVTEDNTGQFVIEIFLSGEVAPAGTLIDTLLLDAANPLGVLSGVSLVATKGYRARAEGDFFFGASLRRHDAECLSVADGPGLRQDGSDVQNATPDVHFQGSQVNWVATRGRTGCNDDTHAYIHEFTAVSGQVRFRVNDGYYADNNGVVTIQLFELPAP